LIDMGDTGGCNRLIQRLDLEAEDANDGGLADEVGDVDGAASTAVVRGVMTADPSRVEEASDADDAAGTDEAVAVDVGGLADDAMVLDVGGLVEGASDADDAAGTEAVGVDVGGLADEAMVVDDTRRLKRMLLVGRGAVPGSVFIFLVAAPSRFSRRLRGFIFLRIAIPKQTLAKALAL
jgi:hypothetical protein